MPDPTPPVVYELARDQETIVRTAHQFHRCHVAKSPEAEGDAWRVANEVVRRWAAAGRASELLDPLLDDPSTVVRFAAATYAVEHAPSEHAWEVLAEIHKTKDRDEAFYMVHAGILLRDHGRLPRRQFG
jgi:hypothetical protein